MCVYGAHMCLDFHGSRDEAHHGHHFMFLLRSALFFLSSSTDVCLCTSVHTQVFLGMFIGFCLVCFLSLPFKLGEGAKGV